MLEAGASKNWQELLLEVTGTNKLDATPIISYFKPLVEFLNKTAETEKYAKGWDFSSFEDLYGEDSSTPKDEEDNNVAAIVVGIILGVVVLVIVLGYFFGKKCRK